MMGVTHRRRHVVTNFAVPVDDILTNFAHTIEERKGQALLD